MKKLVFALLLLALVIIPLVSAQTLPEAGGPGLAAAPLADPSLLSEPMTVSLGGGRFASYIPVADLDANQDFTAIGDTFASEVSSGSTHGGDWSLELGCYKGMESRIYVAFNCGVIPSSATVTFARFSIYLAESSAQSSVSSELRRVINYWSSSSLSWNNKPGSNYDGSRSIDLAPGYKDYTCTSLVESYWKGHDYGSGGNLGLELRPGGCGSDYGLWFNSRECTEYRPWLYVEWTEGDVTPTATHTPGPTPTATREPGPGVQVDKEVLDAPGNRVLLGDVVEFKLTVTNSGDSTLTSILLVDEYPFPCFEFVDANPAPDAHDPMMHTLTWHNLCSTFGGNLAPGDSFEVRVRLRAAQDCPFGVENCAFVPVAIDEQRRQVASARSCVVLWIELPPPDLEVRKAFLDPEVCVDDIAVAAVSLFNVGQTPIDTMVMTDTYDTTYLEWLVPAGFGPDDGEVEIPMAFLPGLPAGIGVPVFVGFRAKAETPLTTNLAEASVYGYPSSYDSDTAGLTILPEAGPCEGNLVINGGFESGWDSWTTHQGFPFLTSGGYVGAHSLGLGIDPLQPDELRSDLVAQIVAIPADAHGARLSWWYSVESLDNDILQNAFMVHVIDLTTSAHAYALPPTAVTGGWVQAGFDLTGSVGHTVVIMFQAINDGDGCGSLWAAVDEVEICVSRCGPPHDIPRPGDGICWKSSYPDYAPEGMPDFDQGNWEELVLPYAPFMDGPAAAANCLWWYDSKYEPGNTPPPAISDGYPLVESYNTDWDDHDPRNVVPLVDDLAEHMEADGLPSDAGAYKGTVPNMMKAGIEAYLLTKDLQNDYAVDVVKAPDYDLVQDHILQCDDVIMLLGFWEMQPDGWRRLGGHWVTGAGIDCVYGDEIAISDPEIDSAEMGYPGVFMPVAGHTAPHDADVHFDAAWLSHDVYSVWRNPVPGGHARFGLNQYVRWDDAIMDWYPLFERYEGANLPADLAPFATDDFQGGQIETRVEYAVIVSPISELVRLELRPGSISTPLNQVFEVNLWASSRTQPFESVDAFLDFDPSVLQCVAADGAPITTVPAQALTQVLASTVDNVDGAINLSMRVPLGSPAVVGDVLVAKLFFKAVDDSPAGGSYIDFCHLSPRESSVLSGADELLGNAHGTTINTTASARLTVEVALEGHGPSPDPSWVGPVQFELLDPVALTTVAMHAATTDAHGRFTIDAIPAGSYALRVKGIHTLANRSGSVTLGTGDQTVHLGTLMEGDVDNSNIVNASDASLLNAAFGSSPGDANWDERADLNEDDAVTTADMNLLAANYGQIGDNNVSASPAAFRELAADRQRYDVGAAAEGSIVVQNGGELTRIMGVGEVIAIDVIASAGSDLFDTVDIHISYPQNSLQVVNASGTPVTEVEPQGGFSLVLANEVDAASGLIHYAATQAGGSKTGDVIVARYYVKALAAGESRLRFGVWDPNKTSVQYLGQEMLSGWPATTVMVRGAEGIYIPLISKE